MKVSLNTNFIEGPFGGGMQFANFLKSYLLSKNVKVINHLKDADIDVILHINPFPFLMQSSSYSFFDAYAYKLKHPKVAIIQRINECDERKGTNYMNQLQIKASRYSDYVVFIASWLIPLYIKQGFNSQKQNRVILNGADTSVFNQLNKIDYKEGDKLRIVTHHWGASYLKGHDIYEKLDKLLDKKEFNSKFEFTYIGNLPSNVQYKNTKVLKPMNGIKLASELKKHHIYLTASRNEPAGMHHIEGALCGLPLLYINSGALSEYCDNFGVCFEEYNFEEKLLQMGNEFHFWKNEILKYDKTAKKMANEYFSLFIKLFKERRNSLVGKKSIFKTFIFSVYSWIYHIFKKILFSL